MSIADQTFINFDTIDARSVVVTLYTGPDGRPCGSYKGPAGGFDDPDLVCCSSPDDHLYAELAIIRAWEIARELRSMLCLVDPECLWPTLAGDSLAGSRRRGLARLRPN